MDALPQKKEVSRKSARPTIRDVAREAGVSIATVSRALNRVRNCEPDTRRKVEAAAQSLGYRKNVAGAILGSGRHLRRSRRRLPVFGFLHLPQQGEPRTKMLGLIDELREREQVDLLPLVADRLEEIPGLLRRLRARGGEGLILDVRTEEPFWERPWGWSKHALVSMASTNIDAPFHTVGRAYVQELRLLWHDLVRRGYRRIGAVLGSHRYKEQTDYARQAGVVAGQMEFAQELDAIPPLLGPMKPEPAAFGAWLEKHRPDVVVCFGIQAWWTLQELGVRVPEDLGMAVLHGGGREIWEAKGRLILSGYEEDLEGVLGTALTFLSGQVKHGLWGKPKRREFIELMSRWVEGNSLHPRPPADTAEEGSTEMELAEAEQD